MTHSNPRDPSRNPGSASENGLSIAVPLVTQDTDRLPHIHRAV
jgi:hypothetical protein